MQGMYGQKVSGDGGIKVFVGGLPQSVNNQVLREFFQQFGPVESSEVMMDRNTKRSRGFGYVLSTSGTWK